MDYVKCEGCGREIFVLSDAYRIDNEVYCTRCIKDVVDDMFRFTVLEHDCTGDDEEDAYDEYCDEKFEEERNRRYGIDL